MLARKEHLVQLEQLVRKAQAVQLDRKVQLEVDQLVHKDPQDQQVLTELMEMLVQQDLPEIHHPLIQSHLPAVVLAVVV